MAIAALTQFEAVRLFVDRALAAQPAFLLTAQNATTVADICRRLDGIPLALELAAARVRTLSVKTIAARLSDRFQLLTGGDRTAPPKQQTLRACIDWSYDLLTKAERVLLQRLAVFAGGWTLEAAEAVAAGRAAEANQILDLLTKLVEKSLVVIEAEGRRYRLLETVRHYARDRLMESRGGKAVRKRHCDYFLALAEEAELKLTGAEQAEWLQQLEEEHENLRAALSWNLEEAGSGGGGLRLCGALERFWNTRGHLSEGRVWCARALGKAGGEVPTLERAKALNTAATLAYYQGDYLAAQTLYDDSLAIRRDLSDPVGIARTLNNLGNVAWQQGELASAQALYEESLTIARDQKDRWGIGHSLTNLAGITFAQGNFASARARYEECLAIWRDLEDKGRIAITLHSLGYVVHEEGDYHTAGKLYQEALAIWRDLRDQAGIANSLEELAAVVAALDRSLRAVRLWGAAERLREDVGSPLSPNLRSHYGPCVTAARAALRDDAAFDGAWQEGRALTLKQAIGLALEKIAAPP